MTPRMTLDRAVLVGAISMVCAACGASGQVTTTSAQLPAAGHVQVSAMLRERCAIDPARIGEPPRFAYDAAEILDADRAVLDELVACVTEGALRGRRLEIVGQADAPSGAAVLHPGSAHADAVARYLELSGVATAQLAQSAREAGGARGEERRVDIDVR